MAQKRLRLLVSNLEEVKSKDSPSLTTPQKYAEAVGCKLEIRLVPQIA